MPIILKAKVITAAPVEEDESPEIEAKTEDTIDEEPQEQEEHIASTNPDDPGYVDMSKFFVSDLGDDAAGPSVALDTLDSFDNQDLEQQVQPENKGLTASFVVEPAVSSLNIDVSRLPENMVDASDSGEELKDADAKIFDLIIAYLAVIPQPTDEQFHMLAQSVNMSPEALEAYVYRLTSIMLEDDELSDDARALIHENL